MNVGTKSLMWGAHQFILHPLILAFCWWKLYGLPLDPRLWIAFIVHDWGYFGKTDMDGEDGVTHPYYGAYLVHKLFGERWYRFTLYHSRFVHKAHAQTAFDNMFLCGDFPSKLCIADKLAIVYTPLRMYCREELLEYIENHYPNFRDTRDDWLSDEDVLFNLRFEWKANLDKKCLDFVNLTKDKAYGPSDYKVGNSKL